MKCKQKALLVDYEAVHTCSGGVNLFTTGGGARLCVRGDRQDCDDIMWGSMLGYRLEKWENNN